MTRALADYPHARMPMRTIAAMHHFRVVLYDGQVLYLSPAQRKLYDLETGNDRRNFLLSVPVVRFDGKITKAVASMDENGVVKL